MVPLLLLLLLILIITILSVNNNNIQFGGAKTGTTESEEQCVCTNKYSTENLGKLLTSSKQNEESEQIPEFDITSGAKKLLIQKPSTVKIDRVKNGSLCKRLLSSGFNPKWTIHDIYLMSMTPSGKKQLTDINNKIGGTIRHKDIAKCFPMYLGQRGYICKKNNQQENNQEENSKQENNQQETNQQENNQQEKSNQESNHCHWQSIENDIHHSVAEFYQSESDDTDPEKIVLQSSYTIQRAMLEVKNIINLFQNKDKKEFSEFIKNKKEQNMSGLKLDGTNYSIPWYIFGKYTVCFGR
jgi:hypothetical protein